MQRNNSIQTPWYNSKLAIVIYHMLAWSLVLTLPLWFSPPFDTPRTVPGRMGFESIVFVQNLFWIIVFYLNAYVLLPLLNKKRVLLYFLAHAVTLAILLFTSHWFLQQATLSVTQRGDILALHPNPGFLVIPYTFVVAISTSYRLILERIRTRNLLKEKETESLRSELSLLRSQVSPHFMFNVLNSMVALARKKEDLEPSLLRLSSLMRYMVYSSNEDKVPLQKELEYLRSYMELQLLRFQDGIDVSYVVDNHSSGDCRIEPMILIPFVENAFKHGTATIDEPSIIIHLHINPQNRLHLKVQNKYSANQITTDDASGIGLDNVRKRLALSYPDKYSLSIRNESLFFTVELVLDLA